MRPMTACTAIPNPSNLRSVPGNASNFGRTKPLPDVLVRYPPTNPFDREGREGREETNRQFIRAHRDLRG